MSCALLRLALPTLLLSACLVTLLVLNGILFFFSFHYCFLFASGVATTDLHNIACGPVTQDLPLLDGLQTVGRLSFDVEMVERRNIVITHRDIELVVDGTSGVIGPITFKMWYRKDGIRKSVAMPFAARIPDPPRVRALACSYARVLQQSSCEPRTPRADCVRGVFR